MIGDKFTYSDHDGDRLVIELDYWSDGTEGVYFHTPESGATVALSDLPDLIKFLSEIVRVLGNGKKS